MKFTGVGGNTSCEGKQKFMTQAQAAERLSHKRRHDTQQYHCVICGCWHNGSVEARRKKVLARKAKRQTKLKKAEVYDERYDYETT